MSNRGSFGSYGDSYGSYQTQQGNVGGVARDGSNEFVRLSQAIGNNIHKVTHNVAQMQRMVNQIGTSQDTPQLRDKLHELQHYTNQVAKDTTNYLRDLARYTQIANQSEQRQRKMQKERLMSEFTAALNNFQGAQRTAAEKEKASVARARASSGYLNDPFSDDKRSDDQLVGLDSPTTQTQVQMEQDIDLQLIQQREQEIRKLESDILDVNQIFKDLGMLIHEQGEVIDSIEANVESTHVHVTEGARQLQNAKQYQSKARRKKCILLIVLLLVLGIVGLIIGITNRSRRRLCMLISTGIVIVLVIAVIIYAST